jgi:hypothetical protein
VREKQKEEKNGAYNTRRKKKQTCDFVFRDIIMHAMHACMIITFVPFALPGEFVLLHVLADTIAARTLTVTLCFACTTAIATGTESSCGGPHGCARCTVRHCHHHHIAARQVVVGGCQCCWVLLLLLLLHHSHHHVVVVIAVHTVHDGSFVVACCCCCRLFLVAAAAAASFQTRNVSLVC